MYSSVCMMVEHNCTESGNTSIPVQLYHTGRRVRVLGIYSLETVLSSTVHIYCTTGTVGKSNFSQSDLWSEPSTCESNPLQYHTTEDRQL